MFTSRFSGLFPLTRSITRNFTTKTNVIPPRSNNGVLIGLGVVGLGGFGLYHMYKKSCLPDSFSTIETETNIDAITQITQIEQTTATRVKSAYKYVLGGLGLTAGLSALLFKTQLPHAIINSNKWLVLGCSLAAIIPTLIGTMATDYHQNPVLKHALWSGFNLSMAGTLCTLGFFGGALIAQAALATACVVGGLSFVAMNAKPGALETYEPMFGIGLGVIVAAALGNFIFPVPFLHNLVLYGGLAVFSGLTLTDTRRVIKMAEEQETFDPINASLNLYLDAINIFIRVLEIMATIKDKK